MRDHACATTWRRIERHNPLVSRLALNVRNLCHTIFFGLSWDGAWDCSAARIWTNSLKIEWDLNYYHTKIVLSLLNYHQLFLDLGSSQHFSDPPRHNFIKGSWMGTKWWFLPSPMYGSTKMLQKSNGLKFIWSWRRYECPIIYFTQKILHIYIV